MVIDFPLLKIFYIYFPTWSESVVSMPLLWFGSFCFWMPRSNPLLAVPTQNELPVLIHTWNDPKMNIHKSQMICILKDKSQEESQDLFAANSFLFPVTLAVLLCVTLRRVLWNVLLFSEDIYQQGIDPEVSLDRQILFDTGVFGLSSCYILYVRLPIGWGNQGRPWNHLFLGTAISPGRWNLMAELWRKVFSPAIGRNLGQLLSGS